MLSIGLLIAVVVLLVPIPGTGDSFGGYLSSAGDTSTASTQTRLDLWKQAIDLIPAHAVIGAGPGLIGSLAPGTNTRPFYAHNVFLDAAVELGIVGATALIALLVLGMRAARRRGSELAFALLAAFVVAGLFDDVLYLPRNGLILAVAFALIVGPKQSRKRPGAPPERRVEPKEENESRPAQRAREPALARD
jgi:O-antigen ligase